MARCRVDTLLVEQGVFASREQARSAIMSGAVVVGGVRVTKPGMLVDSAACIDVAARPRYVSRGGYKLERALDVFGIGVVGVRAIDVGASTGGFTDCLLQRGARSVCAVDVGYGQLAWEIRNDPRVAVFERTNIRHVDPRTLGAPFDTVVVDVSFIGLAKVIEVLRALMAETADLVMLVKPQFEVGKGRVGKRGVVCDPEVHAEVVRAAVVTAEERRLVVRGVTWSPLTGPHGNIEYWLWATRSGEAVPLEIEALVVSAHCELGV